MRIYKVEIHIHYIYIYIYAHMNLFKIEFDPHPIMIFH